MIILPKLNFTRRDWTIIDVVMTVIETPLEAGILSINMIEGGSPVNLVVDKVRMKGTLRSLSDETLDRMTKRVEAIVKRTAQAYECRVDILWKEKIPAVWNSSEMTKEAIRCVEKSSSSIVNAPPTLVGEDFALYRRYVPSFFFWVGSRMVGADIHELHTPQFFADDSAITYAAELYAACAV